MDIAYSYNPFYSTPSDEHEAQLLEAFLGTYTYNWQIMNNDDSNRTVTVRFMAANVAGLQSLTRIPGTERFIFGDRESGCWATTTQYFLWEENISY
jgi:hypothetical protein